MKLLKTLPFFILCLLLSPLAYSDDATQLTKQRQLFQQAKKALQDNQIPRYQALYKQLDGYPLQGYLQYLYLNGRLNQASNASMHEFLTKEDGSFYAERLRNFWLNKLAQQKRWTDYLSFYQAPQTATRQCYYLQALLATGQKQKAFEQAPELWLVPHSQEKACDPGFSAWEAAGLLNKDLRHRRMMLAIRDNQFSMANYLAKSTANPEQNQLLVKQWQSIHDNPLPVLNGVAKDKTLSKDNALNREIIIHGLQRLARRSPEQAFNSWLNIKPRYQFTQQDVIEVRKAIGKWAALNRDKKALTYFGDIPGGEWQARAALWQKDWKAVEKAIKLMNIDELGSTRWQYWLGRSQEAQGQKAAADQTFSAILGKRDYYSFLASDHLTQPYKMNHRPIPVTKEEMAALRKQPAIQRLHEFFLQNMHLEARREAYHLKQTQPDRELQMIAMITHEWGWHNQTIALLGKAQYWDALDLRFPVVYDDAMLQAGKAQGLDPSWLLAIARQESAFNPEARSHAGAMGLMQLMPDTGRLISNIINRPLKQLSELYRPERNIELGSAYLRRMYDENQKNPVLATAAYNAGPHRVNKWLPDSSLDADIWAENIPFNETRHYVQTVMSYAAIFDSQRNQSIKPLSERMPKVKSE